MRRSPKRVKPANIFEKILKMEHDDPLRASAWATEETENHVEIEPEIHTIADTSFDEEVKFVEELPEPVKASFD